MAHNVAHFSGKPPPFCPSPVGPLLLMVRLRSEVWFLWVCKEESFRFHGSPQGFQDFRGSGRTRRRLPSPCREDRVGFPFHRHRSLGNKNRLYDNGTRCRWVWCPSPSKEQHAGTIRRGTDNGTKHSFVTGTEKIVLPRIPPNAYRYTLTGTGPTPVPPRRPQLRLGHMPMRPQLRLGPVWEQSAKEYYLCIFRHYHLYTNLFTFISSCHDASSTYLRRTTSSAHLRGRISLEEETKHTVRHEIHV